MKRFYILTGVMVLAVLAASSFAFNFGGSGGGGKRYNVSVSKLEIKGPAWSAAENYSSTTTRQHAVTYGGSTWIALANNINQTPSDGSAYWAKYIAQGPTGPTGAKGDTGSVTSSTGLDVAQRQHSSSYVKMYQPADNGSNFAISKPRNDITTSPIWEFGDSQIFVNNVPYAGSGGGDSFTTNPRSAYTNMSTNKFYIPASFAKHVLPLAGANKNLYVMAQTSSAHISTKTETGVIRQMGGITSTAGYTVRIPKGSLYWFVAKESGFWEAFKIIGSDITQYIADFAAILGISPSTKTFADTNTGNSSAPQAFKVSNTGNATGNLGTFALYSTNANQFAISNNTCGSTLAPSASCSMDVAFFPTTTGAKSAYVGNGTLSAPLAGTGTSAATYLVDNDLNSSGTPSGWVVASGSPFGYTPAMSGFAYSARITSVNSFKTPTFAATGDVYVAAKIELKTSIGANSARYFSFQTSGDVNTAWLTFNSQGKLQVSDGTIVTASTTSLALDTPIYVKLRYQKGTGSNGILTGWDSPTGANGTWTQRVQRTVSTATADVVKVLSIGESGGSLVLLNNYRVSNTDINY